MRKKTIWTVAAGTTAAVLVPGVAYALVAGGPSLPEERGGVGGGAVTESDAQRDVVSAASANAPSPEQVPPVEDMALSPIHI
ncbi:hypothetical protein, partial [Brachybacterium sp. Marseille-Q7125]|uniref:hypothetical protein n=1 Tax=Brachybacterium sp. Marseille-Q7125 TaxID=2932815 RepID=UPI001FF374B6